ncbi:MAG: DNA-directed RNA polymerase subunit beta', partial [Gammaproteobacteria bacterium]
KLATKKSFALIQIYLLKKIKDVYSNQGINVNEKHFEILIKQMTCKVIIRKPGNSQLLNSEIVYFNKVEKINKNLKKKAKYEPIIIGISKLVKLNDGFLSSASFQETTNIISKSAIEGRIDWLNGLKENIILGNIIPAGTGKAHKN